MLEKQHHDHDRPSEANLATLVQLITLVNRCWHTMREREADGEVTRALRDQKTTLQVELLTEFPQRVTMVRDDDESRPLFSLRLSPPVRLPGGEIRGDAMHLPVDLAEQFMTDAERSAREAGGKK